MKNVLSILFPAPFISFRANWKEAWSNAAFKKQFIFIFTFIVFIALTIPYYFKYLQNRPGYQLDDFVLNYLTARDMSWCIFLLIYGLILLAIANISTNAFMFLKCLQAYGLLLTIRILCLFLVPLEPEQFIIPLQDPILGHFFYKGSVITKDLFFSGHISTMSLLCFAFPYRPLKYFFVLATVLVAVLILVQHVHYTIDIIAAPFFSWLCYYYIISKYTFQKNIKK